MKRVVVLSAWCICGRSRAFTVLKRAKCVVQNFLNKTDPRVKNLVHFVNDEDKAAEFAYALSLEGEYLTQNATQMVVAAADHVQLALDMERLAALTKTHANSSRTAEDVQAAVKATRQVLDQVHAAQRWLSEAEDMVTDTVQIMARVESANTEAASSAATSIHAIRLLRRYGESVAEDFACGRSLARVSRKRALKREEDCVDLLCQACVDLRQVMLKLGTLRQHGNGSSRPSSSTHPLSFVKWLSERDENGCSRVVDPATALDDAEHLLGAIQQEGYQAKAMVKGLTMEKLHITYQDQNQDQYQYQFLPPSMVPVPGPVPLMVPSKMLVSLAVASKGTP